MGAGIVALGAGAGLQDAKVDALTSDAANIADADALRLQAANSTSRGDKGLNSSINQAPSDVWVLPLRGYRVTSLYGQRWGRLHAGIDLGGIRLGHPINAVHDGTVVLSRYDGGYGYAVRIDHGNGLVTVYGHNSKLLVKEGDQVKAGDVVALAGDTGHSYGVHCHLEIRINDVPQNPINFFKERGVDFFLETESVYGTG